MLRQNDARGRKQAYLNFVAAGSGLSRTHAAGHDDDLGLTPDGFLFSHSEPVFDRGHERDGDGRPRHHGHSEIRGMRLALAEHDALAELEDEMGSDPRVRRAFRRIGARY